jgi:hypothetical protein
MNTYVADSDDEIDGATKKSVNLFQSFAYEPSVPKTIKNAAIAEINDNKQQKIQTTQTRC